MTFRRRCVAAVLLSKLSHRKIHTLLQRGLPLLRSVSLFVVYYTLNVSKVNTNNKLSNYLLIVVVVNLTFDGRVDLFWGASVCGKYV